MFCSRRLKVVNIFINDLNRHIKNSFIKNLWLMQRMEGLINHIELSAVSGRDWDRPGNWTLSPKCCVTAKCFVEGSYGFADGALQITCGPWRARAGPPVGFLGGLGDGGRRAVVSPLSTA